MARRVVTGVNAAGKSVVISSEALPERSNGTVSIPIYSSLPSDSVPVREMPAKIVSTNRPAFHGTSWQIIEFAPSERGRMHTTDGLDYLYILSGEVTMYLDDDAEILLKAGDRLVQGGVAHAWANPSGVPCIAECFVIGVPRDET